MFVRRLRDERNQQGLSLAALSERLSDQLGVTLDKSALARVERSERGVRLDEAVAIARALGLRLEDMIPSEYSLEEEASRLEQDLAEHHAEIARLDAAKEEAESSATVIELRLAELRDRIADEDAGE
jgi:transcriptional regulator with XRE-family HTH domain